MNLHYYFEDIECDVLCDTGTHINNGWYEPHYHRELCNVEYDYEVDISTEDLAEFLGVELNEQSEKTLEKFIDVFGATIEEDEDFIDFMTQKYEEKAREKCQEEND